MEPEKPRFSIGHVLLGLLIAAVFLGLFGAHTENLAYSEFKALLKAGRVEEATVGSETITGQLRLEGLEEVLPAAKVDELRRAGGGKARFVTVRVDDPTLVPDLEAAGIRYAGEVERSWLPVLLTWVLPVVVLFAVWSLLAGRAGPTSGLLQIGKSRARVYLERSTGVTFDDVAGIDEARDELVAGEAGVPFFSLSGSDFVEMFVGVGAARVRDLFAQAQARAPSIIFIFDRQIVVDRPDVRGRKQILEVHTRRVTLAPDVSLGEVAARTPGFAGADLANLVNEAALRAAREEKPAVEMSDFEAAIDRLVVGLERKSRVISPKEKVIAAHHEAGHAVVAESRSHADRVSKISIIPRGVAALGYTQQRPAEDRHIVTRAELLDRLDVLLGGRVAEEIVFGDVSTGAQDDLQRATDIARQMVTLYGMGKALGLATYEQRRQPLFLPVPSAGPREYSEATARRIDEEVRALLDAAHARAQDTLIAKRGLLTSLAALLVEKEVVDRAMLDRLVAEAAPSAA